jgi:RNA recognition motif-containing protein
MTKRLFVNGLPHHVTGEILENFFLAFGVVESVTVMIDKMADRSHSAAFVEMSRESEAEKAIRNLDGTEVEGRTIEVNAAQPRLI